MGAVRFGGWRSRSATGSREGRSPPGEQSSIEHRLSPFLPDLADTGPVGEDALVPIACLPNNPNVEQLKGNAKALRDLVRGGFAEPVELVREHNPRLGELAAGSEAARRFKLADAQLTLARHYGFPSWAKLARHVQVIMELTRSPHIQPIGRPLHDDTARSDELLRLVCLNYGADDPGRVDQARALLAGHPHLAHYSIHTIAAASDAAALAGLLVEHPEEVTAQGGPFGWEPLLYLAYSRLDIPDVGHDAVASARLLLDHGADPNAGYLWEGTYPFTALTGVLGGGEGSQPPHGHAMALARLLLEAGAEANDSQTVYNRELGDLASDDTEFLELLLAHGLGHGDGGPWHQRLQPNHPAPRELIAEALAQAADAGLVRRARLLLAHGADPNGRGLHPAFGGRTAYEGAVLHGNTDVAALLAAAGADTATIEPLTGFIGGCLAGDRPAVESALAADPALLDRAMEREPRLVAIAAELGRPGAVQLLAELGCDINARHGGTALHEAALRGDMALVRLLVDLGADPAIIDTSFNATPSGWAEHGGHPDVAAYLAHSET